MGGHKNIQDLHGQRFGKWLVVSQLNRRAKNGGIYWLCKCDCGTEQEVSSTSLISGRSRSCRRANDCASTKLKCIHGHSVVDLGRTPSGSCRACVRDKRLKREYEISYQEYQDIYSMQQGKCAICGRELNLNYIGKQGWGRGSRVEVDHKHSKELNKRDSVRGLLCGGRWVGCNRKLGKVDNEVWLRNALNYITNPPAQKVLKKSQE